MGLDDLILSDSCKPVPGEPAEPLSSLGGVGGLSSRLPDTPTHSILPPDRGVPPTS